MKIYGDLPKNENQINDVLNDFHLCIGGPYDGCFANDDGSGWFKARNEVTPTEVQNHIANETSIAINETIYEKKSIHLNKEVLHFYIPTDKDLKWAMVQLMNSYTKSSLEKDIKEGKYANKSF